MYQFNLQPRKVSKKDFSYAKSHILGAVQFPLELLFLSQIYNQNAEDCTAFSSVATRENEVLNASYDPSAFWNDELSFAGVSTSQGFSIEVPAAVGVKTGFSPVGNPTIRQDKPSAYFWIHPHDGLDLFDAIRTAIMTQNRPVMAGLMWFNEFTDAAGGIIDKDGLTILGGHAIKVAGFTTKNGAPYLVLQNSWGISMGDKGLFYINRTMTNKLFGQYGVFIWSDDPNPTIKTMGYLQALLQNVVTLLQQLL